MKKIISLLLTLMLAFSVACVHAQTPEFLTEIYTNYTSDYELSILFESSDDVVALLEELEMPEEINNFIDLKSLLKSVLSYDSQMQLQADMSEDFSKIELGITTDLKQSIVPNKNLNVSIDTKTGMWMKLDLSETTPAFEIIYSHPYLNKYMVMNIFEMLNDAERQEILDLYRNIFSKDFMTEVQNFSAELFTKYAEIKLSGTKCVIKIDNDALIAMIDELIPYMAEKMSEYMPMDASENIFAQIPSLKGLQLLGDDGITYNYSLLSGKISKAEIDSDICVNISNIVAMITGEEWEYNAEGLLDFKMTANAKISGYGKTKVDFPELTAENSFTFEDMMPEPVYTEDYTYEIIYPRYYVNVFADEMPVINDKFYIPLRKTIDSAYGGTAQIGYDKGVITVYSEYFPGFSTLTLTVDSTTAYTDDEECAIDTVYLQNGVTYVSEDTFSKLLGWQLDYLTHDMIGGGYHFGFYTLSEL